MGWWLVGAEVILIITAFGGCCGGLIQIWCNSQRKSRCRHIRVLCGCLECEREIESDELMIAEEQMELKAKKMELENKKRKASQNELVIDEEDPVPEGQI